MLRYPSTKQILTVAVLSALLAGCGKESKKATAESNIMDTPPMVVRPEASITPVELGTQLELTESSDKARQDQAVTLAALVVTTTLNLDSGSSAVKQAISAFAGAQPRDSATGALNQLLGDTTTKCGKGGGFKLSLLMGEGEDTRQTGAFNHEEVYFDADFNDCNLGGTSIDGGLGMSLTLGIAELINSASFRIETALTAQDLHVKTGGKEFFADGAAGYKFYTNNGYELTNELYADQFVLNAGLGMNLIDLKLKQINNTATNEWSLGVSALYQAGKTYVSVGSDASNPLKGKGYGYPNNGTIRIETQKPNPNVPDANAVIINFLPVPVSDKYPEGSLLQIATYKADGSLENRLKYSWAAIEGAADLYIKKGIAALPEGEKEAEGEEN